jgi:hypothetical protein
VAERIFPLNPIWCRWVTWSGERRQSTQGQRQPEWGRRSACSSTDLTPFSPLWNRANSPLTIFWCLFEPCIDRDRFSLKK